jgi:sugar-specific transcriptional regulator TrmB
MCCFVTIQQLKKLLREKFVMVSELLRELGLSNGEVSVYNALLDTGKAQLSKIQEKTRIERANIYTILNKLIERGLVSYTIENKKRMFQPTHPQQLITHIEEQKNKLEETQNKIEKELPQLMKKFTAPKTKISAQVFIGSEGIKAAWNEMLEEKEISWIGAGRYVPKMYPAFFAQWNRKRIKNKIPVYNILRYEMRKEIKPWELEEVRFLPKEFSTTPVVINIYGNKVAHCMYGQSKTIFVMESEELAQSYRTYFNYLWKKVAKK